MRLISIYKCLCDETRLRILNLLSLSPLCVCHIQEILGQPQVKVSRHLSYLKERGILKSQRHQQWIIYSLPPKPSEALAENVKCLQACAHTEPVFKKDREKLSALMKSKTIKTLLQEGGCLPPANRKTANCPPKKPTSKSRTGQSR